MSNKTNRRSVLIFIICALIIMVFTTGISAEESGVEFYSDTPTLNNYTRDLSDPQSSTSSAGRVWVDKSVYTKTGDNALTVDIDGHSVTTDDPVLEVFSALGVKDEVSGIVDPPTDLVIIADISSSMSANSGKPEDVESDKDKRPINMTIKKINDLIDFVMAANEKNRVAVTVFGEHGAVLLPLGRYSKVGNKDYLDVVQYKNTDLGGTEEKDTQFFVVNAHAQIEGKSDERKASITNFDSLEEIKEPPRTGEEVSVGDQTCLEAGLETGLRELKYDKTYENNIPHAILLTDGVANDVKPGSWEINESILEKNEPGVPLDENTSPFVIAKTLLTAAFERSLVETRYQKPLVFDEISVNISPDSEHEIGSKLATLSPREEFRGDSENKYIKDAYGIFINVLEGQEASTFKFYDTDYTLNLYETVKENEDVKLITKEDLERNVNYIDHSYDIKADQLDEIFDEITQNIALKSYPLFDPEAENIFGDIGALTYEDPIGEYMRLGEVKSLILFGEEYEVKKVENGDTLEYRVDKDTDGLSKLKIQCLTDEAGNQKLRVTVPEELLPVILNQVELEIKNNQERVKSFRLGEDEKPLRLIYTIVPAPEILTDGKIDADKVDPDYKRTHTEDDKLVFYSNLYKQDDLGQALVSFVPASNNPFFFNQSSQQIYKSNQMKDEDVVKDKLEDTATYYLKHEYYTALPNGSGLKKTEPLSRSGSELKDHVTHDSKLGFFTKVGEDLLGEMDRYRQEKDKNLSTTAPNVENLERNQNKNYSIILGNNAKIAVVSAKNPTLKIEKSHTVGKMEPTKDALTVTAKDIVTYFLTVSNPDAFDSGKITIKDELPQGLVLQEDSISDGGYIDDRIIYWQLDNVEAHSSKTVSFSVTIDPHSTKKVFKNIAFLSNPSDTFEIPSNIVVEKLENSLYEIVKYQSVNGSERTKDHLNVSEGDLLTYTIMVNNTGSVPIYDLNVIDEVPQGLIFHQDSLTSGAQISGRTITWLIPVLNVGKSLEFSYTVTIPHSNDQWENTARGVSDSLEISSNTVSVSSEKAHVSIEKTQAVGESLQTKETLLANDGDTVTYYFKVKNDGAGRADNVVVTDPVPAGLNVLEKSISDDGKLSKGSIVWTLAKLDPNEERLLNFQANVPVNNQIDHYSNTAQVTHDQTEGPFLSNTVELNQPKVTDVSIQKSQSVGGISPTTSELEVGASEIVTYYLLVTNNANTNVNTYQISDTVEKELTILSSSLEENASVIGNTIIWKLTDLKAHTSRVLKYQVQTPSSERIQSWKNTASLILPEETIASNTVKINENIKAPAGVVTPATPTPEEPALIPEETPTVQPSPVTENKDVETPSNNESTKLSTVTTDTNSDTRSVNSTKSDTNKSDTNTESQVHESSVSKVSENPKTGVKTFLLVWVLLCCVGLVLLLSSYMYTLIKFLRKK